jgi:hypothetical protein
LAYGSGGGWLVVVALCTAAVVVRMIRVGREVQRTHRIVISGWCVWCCGYLGVGWAEVLL